MLNFKVLILCLAVSFIFCNQDQQQKDSENERQEDSIFFHHNYEAMLKMINDIHRKCPEVTRVYNLTEPSVLKRNLTVLEMTKNPGIHKPGKPEFKYVANMHGNEVVGKEMVLYLALALCEQYLEGDSLSRFILEETRVHILPSMNPDGWQAAYKYIEKNGKPDWLTGRANAADVDLNRNFPDLNAEMYKHEREHKGRNNHLIKVEKAIANDKSLQPETRAVMRWLASEGFVLSANLHGGDLVANYPYDETRSGKQQEYTACPDDHTFVYLAKSYAYFHATMADERRTPCDKDGDNKPITNGGAWYSVPKGMQDYNYLNTNCFEITLELGCTKFPPGSQLERYWLDNAAALFNYILQSHIGVKGFVSNIQNEPVADAEIKVINLATYLPISHDILSLDDGDYYRLLGDGYYRIEAKSEGYHTNAKCVRIENTIHVSEELNNLTPARQMNFTLTPEKMPRPEDEEEKENCQRLRVDVMEKTRYDDRDLLVHVLSYLEPKGYIDEEETITGPKPKGVKWSVMAPHWSVYELYLHLAEALRKLSVEEMREVVSMLPHAVKEALNEVISSEMK